MIFVKMINILISLVTLICHLVFLWTLKIVELSLVNKASCTKVSSEKYLKTKEIKKIDLIKNDSWIMFLVRGKLITTYWVILLSLGRCFKYAIGKNRINLRCFYFIQQCLKIFYNTCTKVFNLCVAKGFTNIQVQSS